MQTRVTSCMSEASLSQVMYVNVYIIYLKEGVAEHMCRYMYIYIYAYRACDGHIYDVDIFYGLTYDLKIAQRVQFEEHQTMPYQIRDPTLRIFAVSPWQECARIHSRL